MYVWKHVSRKKEVSSTSMPVREGGGMESAEGVRERVMACTLGGGDGGVSWGLDSWGMRWEKGGGKYPWKVPARTR